MRTGSPILPSVAFTGALVLGGIGVGPLLRERAHRTHEVDARFAAKLDGIQRFNANFDALTLELDASPARPATPPSPPTCGPNDRGGR